MTEHKIWIKSLEPFVVCYFMSLDQNQCLRPVEVGDSLRNIVCMMITKRRCNTCWWSNSRLNWSRTWSRYYSSCNAERLWQPWCGCYSFNWRCTCIQLNKSKVYPTQGMGYFSNNFDDLFYHYYASKRLFIIRVENIRT